MAVDEYQIRQQILRLRSVEDLEKRMGSLSPPKKALITKARREIETGKFPQPPKDEWYLR